MALLLLFMQGMVLRHQLIAGEHPGGESCELCRSRQPSTPQLARHIKQDGIRSIINLRGPATGAE